MMALAARAGDVGLKGITLLSRLRAAGGPGSGNFGHAGRPGEIGGSMSGGGQHLSSTERQMSHSNLKRHLENDPKFFDSLVRAGSPSSKEPYAFFARDIMDVHMHGYEGAEKVALGVRFQNPLVAQTKVDASYQLLGKNIIPVEKPVAGRYGDVEKMHFVADRELAEAAKNQGYDAIVLPREVQIIDRSTLPPLKNISFNEKEESYVISDGRLWGYGTGTDDYIDRETKRSLRTTGGKGSGNFGHAGRPGQVGGSASEGPTQNTSSFAMKAKSLPSGIPSAERRIRHEQNEHAYAVLDNGAVLYHGMDDSTGVALNDVPDRELGTTSDPYLNAVFTHNHPRGTGLSRDDVFVAAAHNMREMRAISSDGEIHVATRVGSTWPAADTLVMLADTEEKEVHAEFSRRIRSGSMTIAQAERQHWPEVWTRVARIVNQNGERVRFTVDHES